MNGLGTAIASKIADLLDCTCEAVATEGGGPTCWCGFYPGLEPSWDYCGECSGDVCGMAYVRLVNSFQSTSFPDPIVQIGCASPLALQLAVGVIRCIPVAEENGALPNTQQMWESSLAMIADMGAMFTAICACPDLNAAIGEYTPVGPQGGCAGGEWSLWVPL